MISTEPLKNANLSLKVDSLRIKLKNTLLLNKEIANQNRNLFELFKLLEEYNFNNVKLLKTFEQLGTPQGEVMLPELIKKAKEEKKGKMNDSESDDSDVGK